MQSIVLERAGTLIEYRLDDPIPVDGRLVVRMDHACVLDRDLDAFHYGRGKMPRVFGSSMVGTVVEEAGEGARTGARVLALFDDTEDGALRRYVSIEPRKCHPISSGIPEEGIAMLPDAAIAAGILDALGAVRGHVLVVLGARAGGVVLALAAARAGVVAILVDPSRPRLQRAEELGVIHTINPIAASLPEELEWLTGGVVNFVVDTSGDADYLPGAIASLPPGGVLGLTTQIEAPRALGELAEAGITVRSLTHVPIDMDGAQHITESLDLGRLISLSVPIGEIPAVVPSIIRERGAFLRLTAF